MRVRSDGAGPDEARAGAGLGEDDMPTVVGGGALTVETAGWVDGP